MPTAAAPIISGIVEPFEPTEPSPSIEGALAVLAADVSSGSAVVGGSVVVDVVVAGATGNSTVVLAVSGPNTVFTVKV